MTHTHTILYIEDNPDNMRLIQHVLTGQNYTFYHAETGTEGLEMAKAHQPHLVLLDIHLPDIDGYEVMRLLRESHPNLPIIVITADVIQFDHAHVAQMGVRHVLTKPLRIKELLQTIKLVIGA